MGKLSYKVKNYFKPTPARVQKWALFVKSLTIFLAGSTLVTEYQSAAAATPSTEFQFPWLTFGIGLAGFIADEVLKFYGQTDPDDNAGNGPAQ